MFAWLCSRAAYIGASRSSSLPPGKYNLGNSVSLICSGKATRSTPFGVGEEKYPASNPFLTIYAATVAPLPVISLTRERGISPSSTSTRTIAAKASR